MTNEEFNLLAAKVADGKATKSELLLYNLCFERFQEAEHWKELDIDASLLQRQSWQGIHAIISTKKMPAIKLWPRISIAAAAVAAVLIGVLLLFYINGEKNSYSAAVPAPGKSGATITFADGTKLSLNGAKNGIKIGAGLSYLDGTTVLGLSAGQKLLSTTMLSAETAKGQTYRFTLPDGTDVWLNADSKLTFPSAFDGKDRKISLTGEAFFQVVHNAKQPFKVESNGQSVRDIGTAFNIKAYADEPLTKTTIIEGKAEVTFQDKNSGQLVHGQQAVLKDKDLKIINVNADDEIAWKNGLFVFRSEPIGDIMKRVARWYNVEVVFENPSLAHTRFSGTISRYEHISKLLDILQTTGELKIKIEQRTIVITQ